MTRTSSSTETLTSSLDSPGMSNRILISCSSSRMSHGARISPVEALLLPGNVMASSNSLSMVSSICRIVLIGDRGSKSPVHPQSTQKHQDIEGGHAARPTLNGGGGLVAVGALIGGDVMHVDGGVFVVVGGLSSELKRPSNGAFRGQENGARTGLLAKPLEWNQFRCCNSRAVTNAAIRLRKQIRLLKNARGRGDRRPGRADRVAIADVGRRGGVVELLARLQNLGQRPSRGKRDPRDRGSQR
nr:hypothetical protein Iba_chr05cCG18270 [Ipomoea batatas]